jgi:hypothetical protein
MAAACQNEPFRSVHPITDNELYLVSDPSYNRTCGRKTIGVICEPFGKCSIEGEKENGDFPLGPD